MNVFKYYLPESSHIVFIHSHCHMDIIRLALYILHIIIYLYILHIGVPVYSSQHPSPVNPAPECLLAAVDENSSGSHPAGPPFDVSPPE